MIYYYRVLNQVCASVLVVRFLEGTNIINTSNVKMRNVVINFIFRNIQLLSYVDCRLLTPEI